MTPTIPKRKLASTCKFQTKGPKNGILLSAPHRANFTTLSFPARRFIIPSGGPFITRFRLRTSVWLKHSFLHAHPRHRASL